MTRNTRIFFPTVKWATLRELKVLKTWTVLCAPRTFLHQGQVEQHDLQGRWNFLRTMASYQISRRSLVERYQTGFPTRDAKLGTIRTGELANLWSTGNFIFLSYLKQISAALVMRTWGLTSWGCHTRLLTLAAPMCPVHS